MTVHSEGPTHIVRFDDNEASVCDGDVIQNLAQLRQEAWRIDSVLRRYQDEKGILIDILLAARDSQAPTGQNSLQFSISEDDFRPYGQSVYGDSLRRTSTAAIAVQRMSEDDNGKSGRSERRLESMHFPSVIDKGGRALVTHQKAVAEATEGISRCGSIDSGAASDRYCGQMTAWTFERDQSTTAWTFERDHSIAASEAGFPREDSDAHKHVSAEIAAVETQRDHRSITEDHELVSWVDSLPIQAQRSTASLQPSASLQHSALNGGNSQIEHTARRNAREIVGNRKVAFWSQKFGSGNQRSHEKEGGVGPMRSSRSEVRLMRSSRSLDNRSQTCSSPGVRCLSSSSKHVEMY